MMLSKTRSRSKVRKGPIRDKRHRERVAGLPCVVCRMSNAGEAHHIREAFPRTMGKRIGDNWVVPLCKYHHQHFVFGVHGWDGGAGFWKNHGLDPGAIAAALYAETLATRGKANTNRGDAG